MADGPRCKRRKQANPRRKNGKKRSRVDVRPLRGSRRRPAGDRYPGGQLRVKALLRRELVDAGKLSVARPERG